MLEIVKDGNDVVLKSAREVSKLMIPNNVTIISSECLKDHLYVDIIDIHGKIKNIPHNAFINNKFIAKVIIHEGVECIGPYAFRHNRVIDYIRIPSSIKYIDENAFCNTSFLRVDIDPNHPVYKYEDEKLIDKHSSKVIYEFDSLRYECGLDAVINSMYIHMRNEIDVDTIPLDSLNPLDEELIIPEGVTSIDDWILKDNHIKYLYLPSTIDDINARLLGFCKMLEEIHIHENNKDYMHGNDHKTILTKDGKTLVFILNDATIVDSIDTIGYYAFQNCSMDIFEIPKSIIKLESSAFAECDIDTIIVGEHVEFIGDSAFSSRGIHHLIISNKYCLDGFFNTYPNIYSSKECYERYKEASSLGYMVIDMNYVFNDNYLCRLNEYNHNSFLFINYDLNTFPNITNHILLGYLKNPQFYDNDYIQRLLWNSDIESVLSFIQDKLGLESKLELIEIYQKKDKDQVFSID